MKPGWTDGEANHRSSIDGVDDLARSFRILLLGADESWTRAA